MKKDNKLILVGLLMLGIALIGISLPWMITRDNLNTCLEIKMSEGADFLVSENWNWDCKLLFCDEKEINGTVYKVDCEEIIYRRYI